ncbi:hypothetical protein NBRC116592_01820 [Colwellia sp. KU-HH00111]|uniref:HDOD domain-containing protein n=1 Tax=Colwellia sp. KU-HH00111 TaxID=3127652 RepID=UPI00310A6E44
MTATDYAEQAEDIFVLSDSFIRIKELIDDESSTIDDISDVILIDPALAGAVLKLANSSFFNYPGKIDTISKAVLVLGITEVYNLVIAFFSTQAFRNNDFELGYFDDFWGNSVDCALLIKFLGCSLQVPNAERLFILGLLHNVGELVVKQVCADKVAECQCGEQDCLPWEKQQAVLKFTYGECGAELLKLWQLPYNLVAPIRNQDEGDFTLTNTEAQLLYIAKRIMAQQTVLTQKRLQQLVNDRQFSALGIDKEMISDAIDFCNFERLAILSTLSPASVTIY